MDENLQKEQFSIAYVRAVASAAGFAVSRPELDIDKADLVIAAPGARGTIRSPRIEAQLKCTSRKVLKDDHVAFWLDLQTYDNLRDPALMVPKILIVVIVPDTVTDWVKHSEECLALHHCGYWCSLSGRAECSNETGETVHIPRYQQFTVESLGQIMHRVAQGELP